MRNVRPSSMFSLTTLAAASVAAAAIVGCNDDKPAETRTSGAVTSAHPERAPAPPPPPPPTPSAETPAAVPSAAAPVDWHAKLAPDMKKVLDELASMKGKPIESLSAEEARKQPTPTDAVMAIMKREKIKNTLEDRLKIENTSIVGTAGRIPVRIYTPKEGKGPFPVIVYFHGGGYVIATNDVYQGSAEALADGVGAVVVSPEYGKAPESKFPRAHDDAYDTYLWTVANIAKLHGDATKVALAGESAGGNMAAATAMEARDKKQRLPNQLLLVYPVASDDLDTPSEKEEADAKPLNRPMMAWFTKNYFRTPADGKDARINLVGANLSGLPPTTIINAELDPLRSDGENLARKMKAAGDQVEQKTYPGVTHEFFGMGPVVAEAKNAMAFAVDRLKNGFAK